MPGLAVMTAVGFLDGGVFAIVIAGQGSRARHARGPRNELPRSEQACEQSTLPNSALQQTPLAPRHGAAVRPKSLDRPAFLTPLKGSPSFPDPPWES